jgi:hypothetical protein
MNKWVCFLYLILFVCAFSASASLPEPSETPALAYLDVVSTPLGAEVFFNGDYIGKTPLNYPYSSTDQSVRLLLLQEGYLPFDYYVESGPSPGSTLQLHAWLIPASDIASLGVYSNPDGALVTLNNGQAQTTPWVYHNLAPGRYLVHVAYFGFSAYAGYVDLSAGEAITLSIPLALLGVAGSLQVTSAPAGAAVFVDGVSYGVTNRVIGNLAPGTHSVMVDHSGYEDWHGTVEITSGKVTYLDVKL